MEKRKVDFSSLPMPEALSWLFLLLDVDEIGFGWDTEKHQITYVKFGPEVQINEGVLKYIENGEADAIVLESHAAVQNLLQIANEKPSVA